MHATFEHIYVMGSYDDKRDREYSPLKERVVNGFFFSLKKNKK